MSQSVGRPIQMVRNNYLRFYIHKRSELAVAVSKTEKFNEFIKEAKIRTIKIYNSILSKCNDAQITYYSLSPDSRELIDQIISLHF